ncbi:glycoside hydrolase family 2 protein [Stygiobacter electus]|uniref:Glycoside hydrolase family 2 TIM barrel-domain containing protein n=1 Tax=Stygiobacter electus TaxID=3032292 RepID=A0AAE3P297_9BACT|nr:glycoside hydrolase family 2 TIM barrel-domain containing protein [Stygiobacter electus]MDF1613064.1 glycoside hydrolase family 2 TIM barrel-domain containing protein [Stygiobacter electus]
MNKPKQNINFFLHLLLLTLLIINDNLLQAQPNSLKIKNWELQSSEKINVNGQVISTPNYSTNDWIKAEVPSTVLGTLIKNNIYKDVFVGNNLKNISSAQFEKSWWYRTEFTLPNSSNNKNVILEFDGIIYRANVWLNGKQITTSDKMYGVYRRFHFNLNSAVKFKGKNILAVEIIPPKKGEPSIGFVDWNPIPPDHNMGIWRDVRIKITGDVSINSPFVKSKLNLKNYNSAELTVSSEIVNNSNRKIIGVISGEFDKIKFSKNVELEANEKKLVTFSPQEFSQLKITNPRIWWTHNWGKPELYDLKLKFTIDNKLSDEAKIKFGIREISDYINKDGHRGFKLNGKEILIAGGGWTDHLFLDYDAKNLEHQIQYVKHMGLNAIRLEGIWGNNENLYNLCDKYGILIMVGWSCQWEWDEYIGKPHDEFGAIKTTEEMELISASWEDQIKWLRNHPSILVWIGASDKLARPELEKKYLNILKEIDTTRPYLSSTANRTSELCGNSAVKMNGPYEYVPPIYWSIDSTNGGAFGFNTETGPGPQVPPLESIKKMIPSEHLWPIDSVWNFHCGKNNFSNLNVYNSAMNNRLGKPNNLEEYVTKAQYMNYEGMRAMFEAFTANKPKTTGIIQWMLNAAWPKLWWQLYDYYLMPNGAFYGAKKALEPIHIQYNYKENSVYVVNNTLNKFSSLKAKVEIFSLENSSSPKFYNEMLLGLQPDESKKIFDLPKAEDIKGLSTTYFLVMKLCNNSQEIFSNNFYCLSTKPDVLDNENTNWYMTPIKEYANLTGLNELEKIYAYKQSENKTETGLNYYYTISNKNNKEEIEVELINKADKVAFQIELKLTKGKEGESVLPIFWDDNYFSLMPNEKRIIKGYFYKEDLNGSKPYLQVDGWNIKSKE